MPKVISVMSPTVAAVGDEQHTVEAKLLGPRTDLPQIDVQDVARRDLDLRPAVLDDRKHLKGSL